MVELTKDVMRRLNVPTAYFNVSFSKIPSNCPHKKVLRNYLKNLTKNIDSGRGLYLWGDYSQGKSAIACIILKLAAKQRHLGYWARCSNMCSDIVSERMFDHSMSINDRMLSVPILVIDELLIHDDRRDAYVENIVRERVNEGYATIITSNYSTTKLKTKYPALAEVLKEAVTPIRIDGHDFRKEIAIENKKALS